MTTFNPNATPECDAQTMFDPDISFWKELARGQERRAIIAEEKLRIAIESLECVKNVYISDSTPLYIRDILKEIKQVGK